MGSGAFLVEACRQLGDALVESWHAHDDAGHPADEDEVIFARRLVAQRCLYGVDRNPVAVDLAKVSLWLVTLARDHALTFVDHALRHGDSLVGLSRSQIQAFHWDTSVPESPFKARLRDQLQVVSELRQRIREAGEGVSDWELRDLWDEVQLELGKVRLFGDLVLAAFFGEDKPKARERKRSEYVSVVVSGEVDRYRAWLEERRQVDPPFVPFHWEVELPEVFGRANPGFDAVVGNPPFLGGQKLSGTLSAPYLDYLKLTTPGTLRMTDLVAYFFRRTFSLLRDSGTMGMVATKTIAQSDTRVGGLQRIVQHGGEVFSARKRIPWPGQAAVVVSVVHVVRGEHIGPRFLDGREVPKITSYLCDVGGDEEPARLVASQGRAFSGANINGSGFKFDDRDPGATSLDVMRTLLDSDNRCASRIKPYLGGEEILTDARHLHRRFVIDLNDLSEEEAWEWPALMRIVEAKVRPERMKLKDNTDGKRYKQTWWKWGRQSSALNKAKHSLEMVLVHPFTSSHLAFAFVGADIVVGAPHIVITLDSFAAFSVLQSRSHETWARFFGLSMEDRLRYAPTDCFETFPFPANGRLVPPGGSWQGVLRVSRSANDREQRRPDEDLQSLP